MYNYPIRFRTPHTYTFLFNSGLISSHTFVRVVGVKNHSQQICLADCGRLTTRILISSLRAWSTPYNHMNYNEMQCNKSRTSCRQWQCVMSDVASGVLRLSKYVYGRALPHSSMYERISSQGTAGEPSMALRTDR